MKTFVLCLVLMFPSEKPGGHPSLDFLQDTKEYATLEECSASGKAQMEKAQPEVKGWICLVDETSDRVHPTVKKGEIPL